MPRGSTITEVCIPSPPLAKTHKKATCEETNERHSKDAREDEDSSCNNSAVHAQKISSLWRFCLYTPFNSLWNLSSIPQLLTPLTLVSEFARDNLVQV